MPMPTNPHNTVVDTLRQGQPLLWLRTPTAPTGQIVDECPIDAQVIFQAQQRLDRVAPWFAQVFPDTAHQGGRIESRLEQLSPAHPDRKEVALPHPSGQLLLKRDDCLPISGSVKARGGFHEVLEFAENIAAPLDLDHPVHDFLDDKFRQVASKHRIVVGSTGNLGLSIGTLAAYLGFQATVHMSTEAKAWKKEKLRRLGVNVVEHAGSFSQAIDAGRKATEADPLAYFVDDESSQSLFAGYAVAGLRLKQQLHTHNLSPTTDNPLVVYLPCGVGGGPGGITFGLKLAFGDAVKCIFVEPATTPCMALGVASGKHSDIEVNDIGLTGTTIADGLAVPRPSQFIGHAIGPLIDGFVTVSEEQILANTRALEQAHRRTVEPSAAITYHLPRLTETHWPATPPAAHLLWLTGGAMMPATQHAETAQHYATLPTKCDIDSPHVIKDDQ